MPNRLYKSALLIAATTAATLLSAQAQSQPLSPPSTEIPVPEIKTAFPKLPSVDQLPDRPAMPDVMTMNDGTKVTTPAQWEKRRAEMREILEYYATGHAPPPPGNVKGREVSSQIVAGGKVKYRLVHLTFGPEEKLFLDIGIYTPTTGGPFPTIVMPDMFSPPPGATRLPLLPPETPPAGRNGGFMTYVGTDPNPAARATVRAPGRGRGARGPATNASSQSAPGTAAGTQRGGRGPGFGGPEFTATSNQAILHGFAFVTFYYNDCGEDTHLRLPDGSWAFRTTRFFPAYPGYDWGLIRAWGWGASRIVDYLESDPSIDKSRLILSGVSRTGKAALVTGAFDERFAMVAPIASAGVGTPAMRFSGPGRGGKEGLATMMQFFPNQFGPGLYQFRSHVEKLPFDQHWFMALVAPRPLIALEGLQDGTTNANGVRQSILAAKPAYDFLGASERIGDWWTDRPHGVQAGDWEGLLGFADRFLLHKKVDLDFTRFPDAAYPAETQPAR